MFSLFQKATAYKNSLRYMLQETVDPGQSEASPCLTSVQFRLAGLTAPRHLRHKPGKQ